MVKRQRARPASAAEAKQFEIKALQFRKAMNLSFDSGLNDAAVSEAAHAVILMANAVTAREAGEYFAGEDHGLAADFLEERVGAGSARAAGQMRKMVGLMGMVEDESRRCTAREAADAVKRANRFFNWAEQRLP